MHYHAILGQEEDKAKSCWRFWK